MSPRYRILCYLTIVKKLFLVAIVISWLKAQRPKFNAYILNLKGPKKVGQGPKFGPGAHGLDNHGIQYVLIYTKHEDFVYRVSNSSLVYVQVQY